MQTDAGGPRFNVLGPVEVSLAGRPVLARPSTQRTLAAALLAGGGRPVPVEALAAGIWEGLPPENARKALIVSVHRLRRALGDSKRITLGPAGYRLGVSAGDCDAAAFGELAAEARRERDAGRLERAAERYTRCLRLWRGAAFADVPSLELIADGAARLDKDRSRASQEHAEVLIDLGMHGPAIDGLEALTRSDPFHERLTALRMLALYRAGRQVEALRVYSETREALREELGLDPGRLLQSVHEAVLRRDERLETVSTTRLDEAWGGPARPRLGVSAPSTAAPRELPAEATGFTGRDEELRELETARLGDADRGVPPSPVVVLSGMAGVGKTATAVHWARAVAEQYPDGQLFLNLRGHSALSPLRPIEALTAMLRSLGLDGDRIPSDPERAAARLRTETAEKRLLVLLDNAASAEQVSPLLPGGRDSLVIVTSRDRLAELLARHGGFRLDLAPLTPEESVRLLRAVLRPPRLPDRPELDELARRSGYLPLALRIAAANAADSPGEHPAAASDGDPHAAVKATFDRSYRAMPELARRVLRMLGTAPARSLADEAVVAMAGVGPSAAQRAIERLVQAHMVGRDGRGRLTLHDLIRGYASGLARVSPPEEGSLERLYDWYLDRADAACRLRYPGYTRLWTSERPVAEAGMRDAAQAERWLDDERENLVAVARHAAEHGHGPVAWRLADALRGHGWVEMSASDFLALGQAALRGARAEESDPGQAVAELCVSTAYLKSRDFTDVVRHARRAIEHSRRAGWDAGLASAHHDMSLACGTLGRLREALEHGEAALAMNRAARRRRAVSVNLGALGVLHGDLGSPRVERRLLTEALALAEEIGSPALQASHLRGLAAVSIRLGAMADAGRHLDRVMDIEARAGEREPSSSTAAFTAEYHAALGRHEDALAYANTVVRQADLGGDRFSKAIGLNAVAAACNGLGRHEEAVATAAQALGAVNAELVKTRLGALVERAVGRLGLDEVDAAEADAELALELARRSGYRGVEDDALNLLAEARLRRGDADGARELAERALDSHRSAGRLPGAAWSMWVLGAAARLGADETAARRLWERVNQSYADMGTPVPARFATAFS